MPIYARTSSGEYKPLDAVYARNSSGEMVSLPVIGNQNGNVFKVRTIDSELPVTLKTNGSYIQNYKLKGKAVQSGTPTPNNPIRPDFCGNLVGTDWTIPITCSGQTVLVYLGQVQTTRRIKKLVLTGEEIITKAAANPVFTMQLSSIGTPLSVNVVTMLSTHYQAQSNVSGTGDVVDMCICIRRGYGTMYIGDTRYDNVADFKSYLATQYAVGTPVTVWYVLAEPETGIVNEPLAKIGDYADEVYVEIPRLKTLSGTTTVDSTLSLKPSVSLTGQIRIAD